MRAMAPGARATWEAIKARYERGDRKVTPAVRRMAEEALGEGPFIRLGKGERPDSADRAANDRSVGPAPDDDGMVVL